MAVFIGLPQNEVDKVNKDLLELHKRVITTYLHQRSLKLKSRKRFFKLYDHYIDEENISEYFYAPIPLFIKMLVRDELYLIKNFSSLKNGTRKTKKRRRK